MPVQLVIVLLAPLKTVCNRVAYPLNALEMMLCVI